MLGQVGDFSVYEMVEKRVSEVLEGAPERFTQEYQQSLESFKEAIYKNIAEFMGNFISFLWDVCFKAGYIVGIPIGYVRGGVEAGTREVLRDNKIIIPDLADIITLNLRGFLDGNVASDMLDRTGVNWDYIMAMFDGLRQRADMYVLSNLYWRNILNDTDVYEQARKLGYDDYQTALILEANRALPTADELIYAFKRWGYTNDEIKDFLKWLGYKGWANEVKLEAFNRIPAIQDIIRFMVREAFNKDAIEKYRMMDEFPEEATEYAEIQGLSRDWVEKYWIAHWELPSPTQVFEMYHRVDKEGGRDKEPITSPYGGETRYRVISKETVDDYLKFADYLHYWRDKLRRISDNVLTRVDVRRMYELGIFNEDDVFFAYIEAGYSEEHAKALTDFTILEVMGAEINKVRNELIDAFVQGTISEEELRQFLKGMHINPRIADLLVAYAVWKKSNEVNKKIISSVRERFIDGDLDETTAWAELAKWGFRTEEISRYLDIWAEERKAKRKYLTKSEILNAFKKGIFSREETIRRLVTYGYTEDDAEVLLKLAGDYTLQ